MPSSGPIAELAVAHDLLVITDEVYEQLVFDGHRHLPLAGYPGMAERTVTISSAAEDVQLSPAGRSGGLAGRVNSSQGCEQPSSS